MMKLLVVMMIMILFYPLLDISNPIKRNFDDDGEKWVDTNGKCLLLIF